MGGCVDTRVPRLCNDFEYHHTKSWTCAKTLGILGILGNIKKNINALPSSEIYALHSSDIHIYEMHVHCSDVTAIYIQ